MLRGQGTSLMMAETDENDERAEGTQGGGQSTMEFSVVAVIVGRNNNSLIVIIAVLFSVLINYSGRYCQHYE